MPIVINQHQILIYDEIGFWGEITAKQFMEDLAAIDDNETLEVRINSPGGSVFDGIAIYNALKRHPGTVDVFIDGIALSMASGIAMAGDTITMAENALMMIHEPQTFAAGDEEEMLKQAKLLSAIRDSLLVAYVNRSGLSKTEVTQIMKDETWLTANEAVDKGFADTIGAEMSIAATFDLPKDLRVPAPLAEHLSKVMGRKPVEDPKPEKKPMSTDTKPDAPTAATLDQLLALNGADNDFAIEQLKASATLEQAQNSLNKILLDRLSAANLDLAEARKRSEEAAAEAAKNNTPDDSGHDPVGNDSDDDNAGKWTDPIATFKGLFKEECKNVRDPLDAYINVHRANPGLVEAGREHANASSQ